MRRSYLTVMAAMTAFVLISFTPFTVSNKKLDKGKKYKLVYSPEKGTSGLMVMDYTMKISLEVMGQSMDVDQHMEMGAKMEVTDNTADEISTKMIYDYFAMTMENPMTGTLAYDSRKEDNDGAMAAEFDKAFADILGQEVNIIQDKTGETIRTEGLAEMAGMNKSQGSLDFSSVMGMSRFPKEAIAIGESWTNIIDDEGSPMKFNITMTLTDVREGKVFIDFTSDVSSNEKYDLSKALEDAEVDSEEQPELDMNGTQTGTFIYEKSSMWLIEGIIKQDLDMTVETMGMKMPMNVLGDMILTVE